MTTATVEPQRSEGAKVRFIGPKMVFGIPGELKPLRGVPKDARVRMRCRAGRCVSVCVRTPLATTHHFIVECADGSWMLSYPQGKNVRIFG